MFGMRIDDQSSLELLQEEHAEELFALVEANRAYLRRWLPWLDMNTSVEDSQSFIRGTLQQFAARNGMTCGIRHRAALAGVIGLHFIDWPHRTTGIGYWIAQAHQGRGLVTRACATLLDHCFHDLKLNRVEIACAPGNTPSCAIPERLGFTREGILRQREWLYDHFVDHVAFSLLAAEWPGSKALPRR